MHFFMATRGVKDVVDRYINDLLAVYFRWSETQRYKNDKVLQLQMRPIQLWDVVFPEEHTKRAMSIICPTHGWDERCKPMAAVLRKALRVAGMPKEYNFGKKDIRGIPSSAYVSVIPIGMKPDVFKNPGDIEQL